MIEGVIEGEELTGRLLVASPRLADPSFTRTVFIVLDHEPAVALGLVLNRPTGVPVDEILSRWHDEATKAEPAVIFSGGPVSPGAVIGLVKRPPSGDPVGWHPVLGEVGTVDLSVAPEDQPDSLGGARLFSGYAGWSARQLDEELSEGAWLCLDAHESDLLTDRPEGLWHDVLRRQGGEIGMLATYPLHPHLN